MGWFYTPLFFKYELILLALVVWFIYRRRPKRPPLMKQYQKQGAKSLAEALIFEQQKVMDEIVKNDRVYDYRRKDHKVKQFSFSPNQIDRLEENDIAKEVPQTIHVPKSSAHREKIQINFELIKEFECYLPVLQGTYSDFIKAVSELKKNLSGFITEEEDREIETLLEEQSYTQLVDFIEKQIESKQDQTVLVESLSVHSLKHLQYGRVLENLEKQSYFVVDYHNLKLYQEIYVILQELLLKYSNEKCKTNHKSFAEFLEKASLETMEELDFSKKLHELGQDVLDILVEDFLNSLKPLKRKKITQYRSFRLILNNTNSKEPEQVGELIKIALRDIHDTYQRIKENVTLQSPEEITSLVQSTLSKSVEKAITSKFDIEDIEKEEKNLRTYIFAITNFLGWYPQNENLITEEEREMLQYFDKLLYSRKARLDIVKDVKQKKAGKVFGEKLCLIETKMQEAENTLQQIEDKHGSLSDIPVKIETPRQCEDYFPLTGVITKIVKDATDVGNIIKLGILEKNKTRSFIVYTGNNVTFSD